jgi:hypothetical protein
LSSWATCRSAPLCRQKRPTTLTIALIEIEPGMLS